MYLDDDVFLPTKERDPHVYYSFLNRQDLIEKMESFETVKLVSSVEDAMEFILQNGCPAFISFDNDLQRPLEGIHLAHWLAEQDMDNLGFIPANFDFVVHSQNTIAGPRIISYLNNYLAQREPLPEVVKKSSPKP